MTLASPGAKRVGGETPHDISVFEIGALTGASPPETGGPRIRSVGRALPPHYAEQSAVLATLKKIWASDEGDGSARNLGRLETLHGAVGVDGRHFTFPIATLEKKRSFAERNQAWVEAALDIGERAASQALTEAGLVPADVDHIFFVTVTGIATPSIDARLVNRLGMRADIKRTPIFGLGCAAGAAGTARAADYLRAFPRDVALLVSVELCSLTFQRDDRSIANAVATGLFGDGSAAVVLAGAARAEAAGPRVLATRSIFYPRTEEILGWQMVDDGFRILLSGDIPRLARERIGPDVDAFLAKEGLKRSDVAHWILHTGGPKVLDALRDALELVPEAISRSRRSLRRLGNLSSASVLFVLADLLDERAARVGDRGVMLAIGPGLCAELVLLQW
jgi:alkylresorcinol/alkylpyrone synthase